MYPKCPYGLTPLNVLKVHVQFKHQNDLSCKRPNCYRDFDSWNVFSKHVRSHIMNQDLMTCPQSRPQATIDDGEINANPDPADIHESCSDKLSPDFDHAKKMIHYSFSSLVAKMYAGIKLPRNAVQTMVDDTINLFEDVVSQIKVCFTLDTAADDKNVSLMIFLGENIQRFKASLKNLDQYTGNLVNYWGQGF